MKVDGIEIPETAECTLIGWPYGPDLSKVARLKVKNNEISKTFDLVELTSELKDEYGLDNALMGEVCKISFIEKENGKQDEEGTMAEIISGQYKKTFIFLKIKKES